MENIKELCSVGCKCRHEQCPSRKRITKGDCMYCGWAIEIYETIHYSWDQYKDYDLHKECVEDFKIARELA